MSTEIEKNIAQIKKDFLVISRQKSGNEKAAALGKSISVYTPENFLSSIIFFLVNAIPNEGIKTKSVLKRILDESTSIALTPLFDDLLVSLRKEAYLTGNIGEFDKLKPYIQKMVEIVAENRCHLTVAALNEVVQNLKNGGEVASSISDEQQKLVRFFTFFNVFQKRLEELNVTDTAAISRFLISLIDMVPRMQVTKPAPAKAGGKV